MILEQFHLTDRVAIVTGSGHGIGRAIALGLAEAGANVVCCARTHADVEETARLVREFGRESLPLTCDVLETEQLEALVEATMERFGRIDVLVNNAGGVIPRPAMKISERSFEKVVRFNLTSPFLLTRMVVPHMIRGSGSGSVVNISSGASAMQIAGMAHYGAAKAGLNQMCRLLAVEFAPSVRVNTIIVGQIDTPGAASVLSDEMKAHAASKIPMKRLGYDTDIAACALYLASPASGWVTGHAITVNGGADEAPLGFPVPTLEELVLGEAD
ncbi:MAG: short-chain dehydrogenase [Deltaproteobacteria bacterium]|nr:short-chain dehydrogenase [Deltaproteobacteria bacterium]